MTSRHQRLVKRLRLLAGNARVKKKGVVAHS